MANSQKALKIKRVFKLHDPVHPTEYDLLVLDENDRDTVYTNLCKQYRVSVKEVNETPIAISIKENPIKNWKGVPARELFEEGMDMETLIASDAAFRAMCQLLVGLGIEAVYKDFNIKDWGDIGAY
jgi:hypothetical protein